MDKKKLKLVARMAVSGTPPEQKIAKKILEREGISDPKDLLKDEDKSSSTDIPSTRDLTRDLKTQIVDELEDVKDELLFDLSIRLRDAYCDLSSIIAEFFKK